MNPPRTTILSLAPWITLALTALLGVYARYINADGAVFQLLSTVAGVCGGAIVQRKADGPTVTTTGGDPPTTEVKS